MRKSSNEEKLLREVCAENPEDFDFIQESLDSTKEQIIDGTKKWIKK